MRSKFGAMKRRKIYSVTGKCLEWEAPGSTERGGHHASGSWNRLVPDWRTGSITQPIPSATFSLASLLWLTLALCNLHVISSLVYDGISDYQVIEGESALLPCNVSATEWDEAQISLLVWYHSANVGTPIYSVDARSSLTGSRHQVAPEFSGRLRMDLAARPPVLQLDSSRATDAGDYRCRVDYRMNRTRQFLIHLNVSVPPKEIVIRDLVGNVVQGMTASPYNEGERVSLFCDAIGGVPPPVVVWRSNDGKILDDTYERLPSEVTRNSLTVIQLDRSHLLQELICEAFPPIADSAKWFTELQSQPRTRNYHSFLRRTSLVLDLNLKPLVVQIQVPNFQPNLNRSLAGTVLTSASTTAVAQAGQLVSQSRLLLVSAGRKTEIECRSWGSRPPAEITWWRGSRRLPSAASRSVSQWASAPTTTEPTNLTISILSFTAVPEDDGQRLTCRADNLHLANEAIEDSVILSVRYAPRLSLSLGAKIPETIRESSDVYFECSVKANPTLSEVVWLFEGKPLVNDAVSGVLLTNQSLVMQRVRREHRGNYQCIASNAEGIAASNKVFLNVLFAPVCKPGQTIIYGVARTELVLIPCEVEAEPVTPITFRWFFNNSLESFELPRKDYTVELIRTPASTLLSEHGKSLLGPTSTLLSHLSLEKVLSTFASNAVSPHGGPSVARSNATYSPRSRLGYGILYCLAENSIGLQRDPCTFTIVEAGPPNPAHSCRIVNVTMTSFVLECVPGENGGLRQMFHLEVYNIEKEHLQVNVTSLEAPVFSVENLPHDTAFTLNVFSSNAKGRSDSVSLRTATTAHAEKHTTNGKKQKVLFFEDMNDLIYSPMFGALIGVLISLFLLCFAVVVFIRHRVCFDQRSTIHAIKESNTNASPVNYGHKAGNGEVSLDKEQLALSHSRSHLPTLNDYLLSTSPGSGEAHLNQANYYRYHQTQTSGASNLQMIQGHSIDANHNTSTSESTALTEMSLVNSIEPGNYYASGCPAYPESFLTRTSHGRQASDLMTNAFTYTSPPATSALYPLSDQLMPLEGTNHSRTGYGEVAHHVSTLGPVIGCIDSLSSTSDKTVEMEEEWLSKHLHHHHYHNRHVDPLSHHPPVSVTRTLLAQHAAAQQPSHSLYSTSPLNVTQQSISIKSGTATTSIVSHGINEMTEDLPSTTVTSVTSV